MRRIPVLPTIIVGLAIATMIGLGVWQLQRMAWKNHLLESYSAAQGLAVIPWPRHIDSSNPPLFRRSTGYCAKVLGWRSASGRNLKAQSGWVHIADCRTANGAEMQTVMGWSERPDSPKWKGGEVSGIIAPDSSHVIRLVAERSAPGLQAAQPPSLEDIPNNHFGYAVQWFLFAAIAGVIYMLALGRRK